uniref:Uncharacterized protein n=1 Tax=Polarella glacialis TaxID=89957 RepID=A0A813LRC9_POLGL|nr:unnamed protein product [Polarella glacialis]
MLQTLLSSANSPGWLEVVKTAKVSSDGVHILSVPADSSGRPPLRVWWIPARESGSALQPLIVFLHGGGLFSNATTYVPFLCPRFCRDCAAAGKVCVEVDYPLSLLPLELVALPFLLASLLTLWLTMSSAAAAAPCLLLGAWTLLRHRQRVQHPAHLKVLWGHSAGGQLASLLQGLVLLSAPLDYRPSSLAR